MKSHRIQLVQASFKVRWMHLHFLGGYDIIAPITAGVAELVDARDLKSLVGYPTCRFESGPRHSDIFHFPREISIIFYLFYFLGFNKP